MSGGVDSSLAAALMAREGWQVSGVTLKLLPGVSTGFGCCGSPSDIDDAKRVCETLAIPHYTLNMSELFEDKVVKPFVEAYLGSLTPNPCVECNRSLKFGHLLALAKAWGAEALATGHYARVKDGRLYKAKNEDKDQSYFLYSLSRSELSLARFPVGELSKSEVRAQARALGLKTADKPESQEICFVPRRDYRGFLKARPEFSREDSAPGPIVDTSGRLVGRHQGLSSYTVGQRKGLGLPGSRPRYVVGLKARENALVVGEAEETFCSEFTAGEVSWTQGRPPEGLRARARIRHRHPPAWASLAPRPGREVSVRFDEPQRAVTAGQAVVFYDGEEVLGGGTISPQGGIQ
ncbi:MAG: tRNA 2-thiouridine(34) synthase MnmA [Elusimicrobia bacterium]|nr:tRNA 2-thiouridine(34) synthase MnmA [Elusimicrobiota bacterium]